MTIPDDVIAIAARAICEDENGPYRNYDEDVEFEFKMMYQSMASAALTAALPILRAAIRAELVQEMIAEADLTDVETDIVRHYVRSIEVIK